MLHFNDGSDWTHKRLLGVKNAYKIPESVEGVAVDVGANIGAFAMVNHGKFDRMILLEPALETFERCKKSVESFENVEAYNYAVHSKSGEKIKLRHYKDGEFSGNATTIDDPAWYRDDEYEEIETISLEDIFEKFDIEKINYLKIDCEGAEYDFLMHKDLSQIEFIGIEIHIQLGQKGIDLFHYICKTHDVIKSQGDGVTMHREITFKLKEEN
jgi:FkbM family methyltransferase